MASNGLQWYSVIKLNLQFTMSCPHRDTLEKKKCYLYRYHQIFLKEVKNYVNFYKYIALVDI